MTEARNAAQAGIGKRAPAAIGPGKGTGARTGRQFLESLKDGREIWLRGERIADVSTHPLFAGMAHELARIYDLQHAPETRDTMTYVAPNGLRVSYSFLCPKTSEDLIRRRRNEEIWVHAVHGMCGRLPDFCASLALGYYEIRSELKALNPALGDNAERYLDYARDNDLCISHGLHDPTMDKSLRPSQDPDRCVRVVKERDDGIIVRGARFNTLGLYSDDIIITPTYIFTENEPEFALWFTVPANAPGLRQICREPFSGRNPLDHPLSNRFEEIDTLIVFDDVFIPWERVMLYREPLAANRLFRGRVAHWATYSAAVLAQYRYELLIAVGHLLAASSGVEKKPEVVAALGEMCVYLRLLRGSLRASEVDGQVSEGGMYYPAPAPERRALQSMIAARFTHLVEQIGTSSLIFLPTAEDWDAPELRKHLDLYMRGKKMSGIDRHKLCRLAWELTGDSFGSRQRFYDRLHSGSPEVMVASAYQQFDLTRGVEAVRQLLELQPEGPRSG
jgi:4-hydroxyphenylacetate 3-monooxygenase oxygenase component